MTSAPDESELLDLARSSALGAQSMLSGLDPTKARDVVSVQHGGREVKIRADLLIDDYIHRRLEGSGLAILSEERVSEFKEPQSGAFWVVDPIDGSVNFLRGIGPSAISLGLWNLGRPAFGVIVNLASRELSFGGKGLRSRSSGSLIRTSAIEDHASAVIATGMPSRVSTSNDAQLLDLAATVSPFGKVRMIGSAAASLLLVAQGGLDAYFENGIMLWDVAAGLAIVEGAGGVIELDQRANWSYQIWSSNGHLRNPNQACSLR
jgi:myo-inositol-1(or 4)-monophosphatase